MVLINTMAECALCGNPVTIGPTERKMLDGNYRLAAVCGLCEEEWRKAHARNEYWKLTEMQDRAQRRLGVGRYSSEMQEHALRQLAKKTAGLAHMKNGRYSSKN